MAAATAAAEGTVRRRASSEWEVGLGLMVWRKHEGVCVSVRGRLSEFEKNRWWDLVLNGLEAGYKRGGANLLNLLDQLHVMTLHDPILVVLLLVFLFLLFSITKYTL